MDSERGRDADAPPRFLGDYPDGAYWTADRPADADRQEPEDHTVKGPVIRFMWDYGVTVPMWDAEGQLPEEPEWLRTSLGLSDGLIDAVIDEGREMNRLDGAGAAFTEEWRARYAEADTRGRSLAEWLQREVAPRFEVRYEPWWPGRSRPRRRTNPPAPRIAVMPDISRDDVAHLAGLARIQLDDAELDRLGRELPKILDSVATVSQALEGRDDVEPMSHPTPLRNVFRVDEVTPGLTPEEALAGAPASAEQRFLVPKILGEE